jgi:hypothetical protein
MKVDGDLDVIAMAARTLVAGLLGAYLAGSVVLGVVQYAGVEAVGPREVRRAPVACSQPCAALGQARSERLPIARSWATTG